jgi:PadR family transcriptional regulator, regulatory protein PadR
MLHMAPKAGGGPAALESWREQLRRGGLEMAILLCLSRERRYGLEIIRHLEETTDLVVTEGTIYPMLARLAADGVVEAQWEPTEASHPRKYYALTDRGQRRLQEMIEHWKDFAGKLERLIQSARRRA